jgi:hypothetical protein
MRPLRGSAFCFTHDPTNGQGRKAARRKGGRRRSSARSLSRVSEPITLGSPRAIRALLEKAAGDASTLPNTSNRARALGYLAGLAIKLIEVTEIDARIKALEEALRAEASR